MPSPVSTRRNFLKAFGIGITFPSIPRLLRAVQAPSDRPAPRKPNVILVMTDDQGYGDVGVHGNKFIQTPMMDRLHSQCIRLTNFHVAPTCSPTRAGLMTGRYCNRTGVWHTIMGRSILRRDEVTMADVFASGGYRTGFFGKWHLGDNYPSRPGDRGFQEVVRHGGGGVTQLPDYWGNTYFDDTYWHNETPRKYSGYCTDIWFSEAMRFIEANKDRPFFVYLPTNAPHGPYNVPEKYSRLYAGNDNVPNANFWGMITNIDENLGRLDEKLRQLGLLENTLLIFMTDNGTSGGFSGKKGFNAGMRGTKGSEYDGGHRVPCFIRWPAGGFTGGRDVARLTAHIDLLPTLMDICGLSAPKDVKLDGSSILPLLTGNDRNWPDRTLVVDSQRIEHPEKWRKSAVMTDRWRLVNGKELYDMPADPGQTHDVSAQNPQIVQTLRDEYEKWWADVSKQFDEYCHIVIGSDRENPSRLTSHDWHTDDGPVPWNQGAVRRGEAGNGFWAIDVERDGTYEFALRRWPAEVNQPICAAIEDGKAIRASQARIRIGETDQTKPVGPGDAAAVFRIALKAGKTQLQTWFIDDKGPDAPDAEGAKGRKSKKDPLAGEAKSRGAYFVYVKRL